MGDQQHDDKPRVSLLQARLRDMREFSKVKGLGPFNERDVQELIDALSARSAGTRITHPDNIEVMISSLLTVVAHDMREAAEKDLRALVEMASATRSASERTVEKCPRCDWPNRMLSDSDLSM